MSGGSYDYTYQRLDIYLGRLYDDELEDFMIDLQFLLKDLEWWRSGDIGEEAYRDSVSKFKKLWFDGDRSTTCHCGNTMYYCPKCGKRISSREDSF